VIVRLAAGAVLGVWVAGGLLLTLQPAHPAPGQIVEHNFIPLRTISIYLANLDSTFWVRQMVGNLLLLCPWVCAVVDSRSLGRGRRRPADCGGSNPWLRGPAGASDRIAPPLATS